MSSRGEYAPGEAAAGLTWLSAGALVSLALEVAYVGGMVGAIVSPIAALLFNAVLTKTSRLWTTSRLVALAPLGVWLAGFLVTILVLPAFGFSPVPPNAGAVLLLLAGLTGGVWPLLRAK